MIRRATHPDLDQIYTIYKSYCLDIHRLKDSNYTTRIQKEGFIFNLESRNDVLEDVEQANIFDVFDHSGEILGLLIAKPKLYFPEDATNAHWLIPKCKNIHYHSATSITLHLICVKEQNRNKKIGTQLFEHCLRQLKDRGIKSIFSIVTLGPVTNCASLSFHTQAGFVRACVTSPIDILGISNMQSVLFYKDLMTV